MNMHAYSQLSSAKIALVALSALCLPATAARASVSMTIGAGSAVSAISASASFESVAALSDNPYIEGGIAFSRTGLTFFNNGIGYGSGASHVGFTGFSGNYMYGAGRGYFEMKAMDGKLFSGLEFILGNGIPSVLTGVSWTAYLAGVEVGGGAVENLPAGSILGFSGQPFDTLRYTDYGTLNGLPNTPAFDTVNAEFLAASVPEPKTWAMMLSGIALAGAALRRRSPARQPA